MDLPSPAAQSSHPLAPGRASQETPRELQLPLLQPRSCPDLPKTRALALFLSCPPTSLPPPLPPSPSPVLPAGHTLDPLTAAGVPGPGLPQVPAGESGTNVGGRESAGSPRAPAAAAAARAIPVRSVFPSSSPPPPPPPRSRRCPRRWLPGGDRTGRRCFCPPSAAAAAPSAEPSERLKMASLTRRFL